MMVHRLTLGLLLFAVACSCGARAQTAESSRKTFARIKSSAERGSAEAQLQLGDLYAEGDGVTKDPEKAFKWHRKAAEQGLARAQYRLALDYLEGDGVKLSATDAARWFERAAQQGLVEAQYELGMCLVSGLGIRENGAEGIKWFRKAAAQGYGLAEYQIGLCYLQGTGVAKDVDDGIRWIQSSAEKGVGLAQNELATCYQKGEGVPKDEVQAYKWFALAAAQDDEHALDIKVSLAKLESKLTKEQVAQAQRLAHEFKAAQTNLVAAHSGSSGSSAETNREPARSVAAGASRTGLVVVKANLEDCEVFVDGSFVGNSPASLQLPEGTHVIEVKKTGFRDYRRELKVLPGAELTMTPKLEKL